jgi:hypothetical protein
MYIYISNHSLVSITLSNQNLENCIFFNPHPLLPTAAMPNLPYEGCLTGGETNKAFVMIPLTMVLILILHCRWPAYFTLITGLLPSYLSVTV